MTRILKEIVNHDALGRSVPLAEETGPEHVRILLGLRDGAATLGAQLGSIAAQDHADWSLILSDDGSRDDWLPLVTAFAERRAAGRTFVMQGPNAGFARNFLGLARAAGPLVPYAAFCDQDDVWTPCKLARAIAALREVPEGRPGLYCSRTVICGPDLAPLRLSSAFLRPPAFQNALTQNIAGGNTMVMNRAALDLVQDTASMASGVVAHDWWTYQIVTGAGGEVLYDSLPTVHYRQHASNLIGANDTLAAGLRRVAGVLSGRYRDWNGTNIAALRRAGHLLTPEAKLTLDRFAHARRGSLPKRLKALRASGVYRQRRRGTVALWLAAVGGRL